MKVKSEISPVKYCHSISSSIPFLSSKRAQKSQLHILFYADLIKHAIFGFQVRFRFLS
jgi:hypothetical protein